MKKTTSRNPPFDIDRNSGISLSEQIEDGFRKAIACGYYREGDILPSLDELVRLFKVSRIIPRRALRRRAQHVLLLFPEYSGAV